MNYEDIEEIEGYPKIPLGKAKNLSGQIFGKLSVLYRTNKKTATNRKSYWLCKCECGNLKEILGYSLLSGKSKSCGLCSQFFLKNKRFGKLVVLEKSDKKQNDRYLYRCKCDCGTIIETTQGNLVYGRTRSCGCTKMSLGELKISSLLSENMINFKKEFIFKDLFIIKNYPLKFDFGIFKNEKLLYLIEYDGLQHFLCKNIKQRKYDLVKNKYCFDNNIPLIRIPYDADFTEKDLFLETTRFLLTPENEQKYYEERTESEI